VKNCENRPDCDGNRNYEDGTTPFLHLVSLPILGSHGRGVGSSEKYGTGNDSILLPEPDGPQPGQSSTHAHYEPDCHLEEN